MVVQNQFLDAEDSLRNLHEQLFSRKMYHKLQAARHTSEKYGKDFESRLSYSGTTKQQAVDQYLSECHLQIPLAELNPDGKHANMKGVESIQSVFAALHLTDDERMGRVLLLLERCEKLVSAANIDSASWRSIAEPLIEALRSLAHQRSISDIISDVTDELHKVQKVDQQCYEELVDFFDQSEVFDHH